jgi:Domain of unknown function (DUF4190)
MNEPWQPQPPPPPPHTAAPQAIYVQAKTNGFAIASLVLGILWLYWIGSILALVFGYIAKSQIEQSGGRETGAGMAIAGIVLGWIGVGILVLILLLVAAGTATNFSLV